MTPEQRASRGAHYAALLSGGEVTSALNDIEDQFMDEWAKCFDAGERENLWRSVQVVRKIKAIFGQLAGDGKMASYQLTELRRLGK